MGSGLLPVFRRRSGGLRIWVTAVLKNGRIVLESFARVPGRESLVLDTAVNTPIQSAQEIATHYNL